MKRFEYSYSVIKYVHDPTVGEVLNVGILLFAPELRFLGVNVETRFERLSDAFAKFNGDHYRRTLRRLEIAVDRLRTEWDKDALGLSPLPSTIESLTKDLWADSELSFRFGPVLSGLSAAPREALRSIFERMVLSQYEANRSEKRSDEEVWNFYKEPLHKLQVDRVLQPKRISTSDFQISFEHAFKNEQWHALQPLSLDYAKVETLQSKATRWLGNGLALSGHNEMGKLYLLLGRPQLQAHVRAYEKAKALLSKMPLKHQIIEEDEAADFATELAAIIKAHGIDIP